MKPRHDRREASWTAAVLCRFSHARPKAPEGWRTPKPATRNEMKITFQPSGGNLLKGKARDVGALAGVLDGDAQDAALLVHVQQRVLIQVAGLGDVVGLELNVQRVGVLKVSYFHNLNDRSKNALCTVSPSGNSITRNARPSIASIRPAANPSVLLHDFLFRVFDGLFNPLRPDHGAVGALPHGQKIPGEFHEANRSEPPTRKPTIKRPCPHTTS